MIPGKRYAIRSKKFDASKMKQWRSFLKKNEKRKEKFRKMETTTTIIHPPKVSGYEKKLFFLGYQLFATNLRNTLKRNKLHSARFECNEVSFLFPFYDQFKRPLSQKAAGSPAAPAGCYLRRSMAIVAR